MIEMIVAAVCDRRVALRREILRSQSAATIFDGALNNETEPEPFRWKGSARVPRAVVVVSTTTSEYTLFSAKIGSGRMVVECVRRDAEHYTPEACAPSTARINGYARHALLLDGASGEGDLE
jgi:hypothetical protein